MILISEEQLRTILDNSRIETLNAQIIMAKINEANQYRNHNTKKMTMLEKYESMRFDVTCDGIDLDNLKDMYKTVKAYLNDEISFDEAFDKELDNGCPLSDYTWCEVQGINCENCDLSKSKHSNKCKECWERTLKLEKEKNNGRL